MFLFNPQPDAKFKIYSLHEGAITIEFGNEISISIAGQINDFNQLLLRRPFPGLKAAVPAYTTLTLFFDPVLVMHTPALQGIDCFERVSGYIRLLYKDVQPEENHPTKNTLVIPVYYGEPYAPDLEELAKYHHLTSQEIITLHQSATYLVHMIGFTPGFTYLGGLSPLLESPRKAQPRKKVPAGSVGIAGKQTGLYALSTPGGWQIIGCTPIPLFNPHRNPPALLKAGDQVIFKAIDADTFHHYQQMEYANTDQG